jgi:TPP-dependent pyruvate/acetoin dehydrogenase alpha subunit
MGGTDRSLLVEMHRRMLRIRRFEETACELAAKGLLPGSVHTSINQEAAGVGATLALRPDDYMTGTHRSHGHPIGKGADVNGLMAELLGKRTGICKGKGKGGSMHLADFTVGSLGESGIVGSGVPIAVGAGLAADVRGSDQVALAFFGDGASNAGGIHEAMNLASIWKLPVISSARTTASRSRSPSSAQPRSETSRPARPDMRCPERSSTGRTQWRSTRQQPPPSRGRVPARDRR